MATANCGFFFSSEDKLKLFSIKNMIEHGTVKSVDSLPPSATPANRHTSGIIIYPALSRKRSIAK